MTKKIIWIIIISGIGIIPLNADSIEIIYPWREPSTEFEKIIYERLIKTMRPQNAYYYYTMYIRSKDDILVSQSWIPEKITINGKKASYEEYTKLIESNQPAQHSITYYQETPEGLLKLGEISEGNEIFKVKNKFVSKIESEIGEKSEVSMWQIGGLALAASQLAEHFKKDGEIKAAFPIAILTPSIITGTVSTPFYFDGSASYDPHEKQSTLRVRWDWENDGAWDTEYSYAKTATHIYASTGTYTVIMELLDSEKYKIQAAATVIVIADGAGLLSSPSPMFHHDIKHTGLSANQEPFTNTIKWSYPTGDKVESSPAIDYSGSNIYFSSYDGNLYKVSPTSATLWSYAAGGLVHSSPSIASDGTIYVGSGTGILHAINSNGTPKWTYTIGAWLKSSPVIADDGTVYIGATNGNLYSINWDGSFGWTKNCGNWIESSPAIATDGTIYAGSADGKLYALNRNSTISWTYATGNAIVSSPAIAADGTIYIGSTDGYLYAINPTGTLKWRYQSGGAIYSSPAIASDDKIYFGSDDGKLYSLTSAGSIVGGFPVATADKIRSSPTIGANGAIYIGSNDGKLYCISPTGTANWDCNIGSAILSTPVIGNSAIVYVGADDNNLYAVGQSPPDPANIVIAKRANKHQVTIGDIVTYQITLTNNGPDPTDPTKTTTIFDKIPYGFKYIKGSSSLNGVIQPDPAGNSTLFFDVGDFTVGESKTLVYQLVVGSGVTNGKYTNKAYAIYYYNLPPVTEARSNTASDEVLVVPDPLFDLGTIIGKVFTDKNDNGIQDNGERGVANAKIIMEDGTIITTDNDGKYHIAGVMPGTHLLKLDSLKVSAEGGSASGRQEFNSSKIVRVTEGLLAKVNFPINPASIINTTSPKSYISLVMLGEGIVGSNKTHGNTDPVKHNDLFDKGFYSQGRIASYLKAEIEDKYRITSSLDTERNKTRELMRYIDPDKYYLTYGDNSRTNWDATNTQGPLYLSIEHLPSSSNLLIGNYPTEINQSSTGGSAGGGNELVTYNRTLYGAKTELKDKLYEIKLFGAQAHQLSAHNEFRSTGGSFYYLNHSNLVEGSEQIRVETRDKITNIPLKSDYKSRGTDYEIDYTNGRIVFIQPIASTNSSTNLISTNLLNGNPVYIIADYEYTPMETNWDKGSYGGKASVTPLKPLTIGTTYVKEETLDKNYVLKGADTSLKLTPKSTLTAEYGESTSFGIPNYLSTNGGLGFSSIANPATSEGAAYSIRLNSQDINKLPFQTYYKRLQPGFITSDTITQQGTEKYGLSSTYKASEKLSFTGRYDVQELLESRNLNFAPAFQLGAEKTNTASLQGKYDPNSKWTLSSEYRHNAVTNPSSAIKAENNADTDSVAARAERHFYGGTFNTYLGQQMTLNGEPNHQTTLGANASIIDPKTLDNIGNARLEATNGTLGSAGLFGIETKLTELFNIYSNYQKGSSRDEGDFSALAFGTAYKPDNNTIIYTQQEYRTTELAQSNADKLGVDRKLNQYWRWSGNFEKSDIQNYDLSETTRYMLSSGIGYVSDSLRLYNKMETRFDENSSGDKDQYLTYNSAKWSLNNGISLQGRFNWSETFDQLRDKIDALYREYGLGVAYRPISFDRLNLIGKYTYLTDKRPLGQTIITSVTNERANIYSIETIYDLTRKIQVVKKYALKNGEEKINANPWVESKTTLWLNRVNYEFIKGWLAGAEYRTLKQYLAQDKKSGWLGEVLYKISQNFHIGAGYNFTDFSDNLEGPSRNGDYSVKGPFIRFLVTIDK